MFERIDGTKTDVPIYRQLANQVFELVSTKKLLPGDRLPPQREIAKQVGVNLTTVTRAFSVLQARGIVESHSGKGTIIVEPNTRFTPRHGIVDQNDYCDLSVNRAATDAYLRATKKLLPKFADDPRFVSIQDYHQPEGHISIRAAMASWLSSATGHDDLERIVVVNGAQHGLACALGAIAQPGQVVLADSITFQGFISLCASQNVILKPVAMDQGGMIPEAFDAACERYKPAAVYLLPNFHNPTTITLNMERREALAQIAHKHNVIIIEDDVYRPLVKNPLPTIASRHPEITVYVTSLSKCAAAGIRLGAVSAPKKILDDIATFLSINCWSTSLFTGLLAAQLIEQCKLPEIIDEQITELKARYAILKNILPSEHLHSQPSCPHAWLTLPEPWRGSTFARAAHKSGIGVLSGESFIVDRNQAPLHAIRLNLNAARSHEELTQAARTLNGLFKGGFRKVDLDV